MFRVQFTWKLSLGMNLHSHASTPSPGQCQEHNAPECGDKMTHVEKRKAISLLSAAQCGEEPLRKYHYSPAVLFGFRRRSACVAHQISNRAGDENVSGRWCGARQCWVAREECDQSDPRKVTLSVDKQSARKALSESRSLS